MSTPILAFPGRFQLWSYTASHSRLLLRRTKGEGYSTQVDIMFKGVASIQIPTMFDGIEVHEARAEQLATVPQLGIQNHSDRVLFRVIGKNVDGFVVAYAVVADEGDREYFEESPLLKNQPIKQF